MMRFHRQALALLAMLLLSGQILAGPLLVCEAMKAGVGVQAGAVMMDPAVGGHHQHSHAHDVQPGHSDLADTAPHMAPEGHDCQHACGLCLASVPFLVYSDGPAALTAHPVRVMAPLSLVLTPGPEIPFRPPIFA